MNQTLKSRIARLEEKTGDQDESGKPKIIFLVDAPDNPDTPPKPMKDAHALILGGNHLSQEPNESEAQFIARSEGELARVKSKKDEHHG